MARLVVMTDSTCDLPREWIERYDIRVVPTYVQFGLESLADDGVQLSRQGFYERMVSDPHHPTTSASPLGETAEVMAQALADADHVIALTAPAILSAIHNNFRLAAEQLDPDRVTLIDSQTLSMGMGWLVITAAEMIEQGADLATITSTITALRPHTDVWAALDTLEYLRRSGRVGWATAMVGELFRIKPIIRLYNSEVMSIKRVRTSHRAFQALIDLAREAAPLERIAFLHTANVENAQRLAAALADLYVDAEPVIVEVTPVIGVHVGPNGLGLAVVRKQG